MIEVGQGVSYTYCTDLTPATIIEVSDKGQTIVIQDDLWEVVRGSEHDGSAEYEYKRDQDGRKMTFTLRKNGRYSLKGQKINTGPLLILSCRRRYYDPHF